MHKITKNDTGKPAIETFENENVRITRFLNGDVETEFKPNCDKKIIQMFIQLNRPIRKREF